ncbi:MAG: LbtU family siderophore porin [Desulfohalobiaceae bacterium]
MLPGLALAADAEQLEKRIDQLEQELEALHSSQQEKEEKKTDPLNKISDRLTFSGLLEVEGIYNSNYEDDASSDLELATLEFGVDAVIHEYVSSHVLFLYEEPTNEDIEVDEAVITLGNPAKFPVYMTAGRQYLPFGVYKTAMVSDPLTLEIAESQETALEVRFEKRGAYGGMYAFNGDVDESDDSKNHIDNFGANAGYNLKTGELATDVSVSYLNNIGDSDTLGDTLQTQANGTIEDYVAGMAASASVNYRSFSLIGEYIFALEEFQQDEVGFDGNGAQMSAWNMEVGYSFAVLGREATMAAAYQGTDEALDLGLPKNRYMTSISVGLFENNVSLSLEYAYDQDYDQDKGGTGDEAQTITTQLAMGF